MKYVLFNLLFSCVLYCSVYAQFTNQFADNWNAINQERSQRIGLDSLNQIEILISLEEFGLYEFAYLTSDNEGNLAGYDFKKERVIYFSKGLDKKIEFLTDGIGRGPRETKLVRDIKFDDNGNIWLADLEGGRITKWSPENKLLISFKPNKKYTRPYRIAICKNFITILSEQYLGEGLYHNFDFNGKNIRSFMTLNDQNKDSFRLWSNASYFRGNINCHDENIYHVGKFKNFIRKYDEGSNLIYSKKVIEFEGNPEPLLEIEKRSSRRKNDVRTISGQVEIVNDKLLVSFSGKRNSYYYLLDAYDLNGNYLKSFQFKYPVKEFTTDGKFIYTLETHRKDMHQYISKYELPEID